MKRNYRPGWRYWYLEFLFSVQVDTVSVEAIKRSCLTQLWYTLQMSVQILVQETQCSCNYSYFSAASSESYQTERITASSQITCQSYSWHLTAAVDRELTNQINEIYLQPARVKQRSWCVMCFVCRRLSQNCGKRLLASSCLSVRPPARKEQLGSYWTDFHKI